MGGDSGRLHRGGDTLVETYRNKNILLWGFILQSAHLGK